MVEGQICTFGKTWARHTWTPITVWCPCNSRLCMLSIHPCGSVVLILSNSSSNSLAFVELFCSTFECTCSWPRVQWWSSTISVSCKELDDCFKWPQEKNSQDQGRIATMFVFLLCLLGSHCWKWIEKQAFWRQVISILNKNQTSGCAEARLLASLELKWSSINYNVSCFQLHSRM